MIRLMTVFAVILVATILLAQPAAAGNITTRGASGIEIGGPSSLFVPVKTRCVRLIKRSGRDALTNLCPICVIARVRRHRPGGGIPASRMVPIPKGATVTLSFRGPGQTRVVGEDSCRPPPTTSQGQASKGPAADPMAKKQCVGLTKTKRGVSVLRNSCGVCRKVMIQRAGMTRPQAFVLKGNGMIPFNPGKTGQSRIVSDQACR